MKISYFQNYIFFIFIFFLASIKIAFGCSYFGNPTPPLSYEFSKTEAVFIGKVETTNIKRRMVDGKKFNIQYVRLKVEKVFKGKIGNFTEIVLSEKVNRTSCDYPMKRLIKGKDYIIFSRVESDYLYGQDYIRAYEYDPIEDENYITKLEKFSKSNEMVIHGQIEKTSEGLLTEPFRNVEILVRGNDLSFSTKPDNDGNFSVTVPASGVYKVKVFTPFSAKDIMVYPNIQTVFDKESKKNFIEYEVNITQNSEEYRYFLLVKTEKQ